MMEAKTVDQKKPPKLSLACKELLDAMRLGVRVHGMSGIDSYFFRADTMRRCSKQVDVLLRLGLVEERNKDWRGCIVVPCEFPRA